MATTVMTSFDSITATLAGGWADRLGQQLFKAIAGVCPELLTNYNNKLASMIHNYAFAREPNEFGLQKLIKKEIRKNNSCKKEHLEILFLTLKGARIIVMEENFVSPMEFDNYMLEKQRVVREMMAQRIEERAETGQIDYYADYNDVSNEFNEESTTDYDEFDEQFPAGENSEN